MIVVNGVRKSWEILRSSVAFNCSFSAADFSFIRSTPSTLTCSIFRFS
ncbi:MAG: hypothetical protein ACLR06_15995 [Christensenellaceae bacterium]